MPTQKVEFAGSRGAALAARLELPAGTLRGYALFAYPFTGGQDQVTAARIARALTESGVAVLHYGRTDPAGPDEDSGAAAFSAGVDDLVRAADHLRVNFQAPFLLIGHSLDGAAVLAARHRIPEVRAAATIAAPADSDDMSQAERIADLDAALLVLHSPTDEVVSVDSARRIFDTARQPKSFVALDGADHLLTNPADAEYAATVLGHHGRAARPHRRRAGPDRRRRRTEPVRPVAGRVRCLHLHDRANVRQPQEVTDQRQRLLEIADKCPVHSEIDITTNTG
jgi:alpha/beta superfamily hydrolase